jgi:hypothetical protein
LKKLIIFGFDALDYDLVEEWDLFFLEQKVYGRIEVPINDKIGIPLSTDVWGSFLTGRELKNLDFEHDIQKHREFIRNILTRIRKYLPLKLGLSKRVSGVTHTRFPELNEKTFIDHPNSRAINVPFYNFDYKSFDAMEEMKRKKITVNDCIIKVSDILKERLEQIREVIISDVDSKVIFAFISALDILQHLILRKDPLFKYYVSLDSFIHSIKKELDNCFTIIISDHGFNFEKKEHGLYGFFSSNKDLDEFPKSITDVSKIVTEFLKNA